MIHTSHDYNSPKTVGREKERGGSEGDKNEERESEKIREGRRKGGGLHAAREQMRDRVDWR